MFFKVVAKFLKIVLFDLKRYCIWLENALYVAGTVCATCLYLVRYEMGLWIKNAYLHVGKKNTDWSKWRDIFSREVAFCKGMLPIKREYSFLLKECYTLWMKLSVCKACSCHLELVLQEKDACLIISCSHLQCFHCLFSGLGKRPKVEWSFSCGLNHYLRETLQRGWGTWRYVN